MLGQKQIDELRCMDGVYWVTALKHVQIRALALAGAISPRRFRKVSHFETVSPTFPGERLIVCRNASLARESTQTRNDLVEATLDEFARVAKSVSSRRLKGQGEIGMAVGKIRNKYKVGKFFKVEIEDNRLQYWVDREAMTKEAATDGIYVIRTNVPVDRWGAAECVRSYKCLARVERAFRSMKTVDLNVRPIRHRLEDRVRAHFFLAMLAYYVEWHLRGAWKPLLFDDEDFIPNEDPVAPAERSETAQTKAEARILPDGTAVHSFQTLLQSLATIVRNTCQHPETGPKAAFQVTTTPNDQQQRALQLIEGIGM